MLHNNNIMNEQEELKTDELKPPVKKKFGGKQEGAGRPKGSMNQSTKLRREAESALHERILARADDIISNQLQLSRGHSYLFKIITDPRTKKKGPAELVTDRDEIIQFLVDRENCDIEGRTEIGNNIYYYISTEKPENKAIDSMLDRVFGKAVNRTELMGKDGSELKGTVVYLPSEQSSEQTNQTPNNESVETTSETGESSALS